MRWFREGAVSRFQVTHEWVYEQPPQDYLTRECDVCGAVEKFKLDPVAIEAFLKAQT